MPPYKVLTASLVINSVDNRQFRSFAQAKCKILLIRFGGLVLAFEYGCLRLARLFSSDSSLTFASFRERRITALVSCLLGILLGSPFLNAVAARVPLGKAPAPIDVASSSSEKRSDIASLGKSSDIVSLGKSSDIASPGKSSDIASSPQLGLVAQIGASSDPGIPRNIEAMLYPEFDFIPLGVDCYNCFWGDAIIDNFVCNIGPMILNPGFELEHALSSTPPTESVYYRVGEFFRRGIAAKRPYFICPYFSKWDNRPRT